MENNKKNNWFTRILIIILCVFIAALITISFVFSEQKFIITGGIIVSVALLVILVLSEIFDSFSVGNILSLRKKLKETNVDLDKSKKENEALRNQLIAQINLIAKQNNTQNIILSDGYEKLLGVEKATNIDEQNDSEQKFEETLENERNLNREVIQKRRLFLRGFEKYAYEKIIDELDVDRTKIFKDVQFKEGMIGVDPIMERNIRFDGYFIQNDCECFLEIKSQLASYSQSVFTIYYILNKIYFYRNATNKNAKLILIVPVVDKQLLKTRTNSEDDFETIRSMFMPAINNNLLEIRPIYVDEVLYEEIISKQESDSEFNLGE